MQSFIGIKCLPADIDECKTKTLQPDCVRCVNTDGTYHCECEAGYGWNAAKEACQGKWEPLSLATPYSMFKHLPRARI